VIENVEYFISEIINVQKSGTYIIVGHSYGGVIALEIAKKLKALGHKVDLILLDTYFQQHRLQGDFNNNSSTIERMEHVESEDNIIFTNECDTTFTTKVKNLYQIQASLFADYEVNNFGGTEPLCIFAQQSDINVDNYLTQLSQYGIEELNHSSVSGNHFTMLEDKGAEGIAKIVSDYVLKKRNNILQTIL
jgi:thioesterase domain-containing protein